MITVNHPWHGAHYGDKSPQKVNALIEIPQGSRAKYEVDKATGLLKLDRVIYSSFYYPCNYGFIPQTYGYDKDPLDIMVLTSLPVQALCLRRLAGESRDREQNGDRAKDFPKIFHGFTLQFYDQMLGLERHRNKEPLHDESV